jgi:hypothetical protein
MLLSVQAAIHKEMRAAYTVLKRTIRLRVLIAGK